MYRNSHNQFNRRYVYHLKLKSSAAEKWTHKVSGGGLDDGMNFYCHWIPAVQAESKLSGSMGASIWKLLECDL